MTIDRYQLRSDNAYLNHWSVKSDSMHLQTPVNTAPRGGRMESVCIPPLNTVPHNGQVDSLWGKRPEVQLSMKRSIPPVRFWGKRWGLELSIKRSIPPVNTGPNEGQNDSFWGKRRGLELTTEPSVPPVSTVQTNNGQMDTFSGMGRGLELSAGRSVSPVSTVPHDGQIDSFWGKRRG